MNLFKFLNKQLLVLIVMTAALRLINLGYSDYIQDEVTTFFYWNGQKNTSMSPYDFLLNEQKGPLQIIVGFIPFTLVGNYSNTLAQRIPFALFGIASVIMFYFTVEKLTKNVRIAFLASFLFSTNGLILAYSRIAQYQNLLFFFTFASLYYFADFLNTDTSKTRLFRSSVLGSVLFAIAFYAHWYAVFILVPIAWIFVTFFLKGNYTLQLKILLAFLSAVFALALTLPYYIPYIENLSSNTRNTAYVENILGKGAPFSTRTDLKQFLLYNPFLVYPLYVLFGLLGIYASRKNIVFMVWFAVVWLFFRFLVSYTGLHFYNIFIPWIALVAYGINYALEQLNSSKSNRAAIALTICVLGFLFLQSYLLFVDHKKEYPMQQETILFFKTKKYTHQDNLRHKTGFPLKRYWKEINEYVNKQNAKSAIKYGYYTNEDKGIARIYMDTEASMGDNIYLIGIKNPYSMAFDRKFPQFKNKVTVHEIENDYGESVVKIYRVDKEKN